MEELAADLESRILYVFLIVESFRGGIIFEMNKKFSTRRSVNTSLDGDLDR